MSSLPEIAGDTVGTDSSAVPARPTIPASERILQVAVPVLVLLLAGFTWHFYVTLAKIPPYILPGPVDVWRAFYEDLTDRQTLLWSLLTTLRITFLALLLALVGGVLMAILLIQSRWIELALYPFAVIMQVTPVVAIAPLLLIYAPNTQTALLIIAFIVAFFPILSNMVQGLKSVDHNLLNLFDLYGASRWQTLVQLKIPASLPYFMTGLRIGGGLALIAAVVAEFAAGSAGAGSGLAFRLLEAGYRMQTSRQFAALILLTVTGVAIFGVTSFIAWLSLHKWHESAVRREN
jgi:NitT/TauT family transport system permease protein